MAHKDQSDLRASQVFRATQALQVQRVPKATKAFKERQVLLDRKALKVLEANVALRV